MPQKQIVLTSKAPAPIGPYSHAVKVGQIVFCSGQIPLDPETGAIVGGQDVVLQAEQVMKNVRAVVEAAGGRLDQVVKSTIFLKNMADFPKVNEVYGKSFVAEPPARSTVEVARLPKYALVEIEVIVSLA